MTKLRDDFNYGIIKKFNEKDGYGFIKSGSEDVYFHFSALKKHGYKKISVGSKVKFLKVIGIKGFQAANVEKIGDSFDEIE